MKKIIASLLVLALVTSCDPKNEHESEENHDNKDVTTDANDPVIGFNDYIVAQVDQSEIILATLMDLDAMDISAQDMITKAEEAKVTLDESIKSVEKLQPVGDGANDFLLATVEHLNNVKLVANVYVDFAEDLAIPDSLWNEEMGSRWLNLAEPLFADYNDSYEQLEMAQGSYAALNNIDIIPSEETIEELYEQSK